MSLTRIVAGAIAVALAALVSLQGAAGPPAISLPNTPDSLKLAVIGDNGTGDRPQYEVADQMAAAHTRFAFGLVLMLGDNFYGGQRPADLEKKFGRPYRPLLDAGVVFQAAIGNHDEGHTVNYPPLNMNGRRYYTFTRPDVRFFVLDTNSLEPAQVRWFENELQASREPWKIAYFHHPLYSNAGRHGDTVEIRVLLEPLMVNYGVNVAFAGHDHSYERLKPQKGIHYFVSGAGGQLRKGDLQPSPTSAAGFDQDQSFMLLEIDRDVLFFQVLSRLGATVDSGSIARSTAKTGTRRARPRTDSPHRRSTAAGRAWPRPSADK
jgi:hypothetical protein